MQHVDLSQLSPQIVWKHFQTLCQIPRPSKQEYVLREHLANWAKQQGLTVYIDRIGNLIIRKPAAPGNEDNVGVILQGHLDMVTQANRGSNHNFMRDPLRPVLEQDWLVTPETTLGADNGIGVALALAVLESTDISHGPIEVLLTVDEEAGMSGARLLEEGILTGQWLFNIDTEEWGELYLGCAGSQDVEVSQALEYVAAPQMDLESVEICVTGLRGGHSGIDIHLGRGNANVILSRFLHQHLAELEGYLIEFHGGTARNALPREASTKIILPKKNIDLLEQRLDEYEAQWLQALKGIDDQFNIDLRLIQDTHHDVLETQQQNHVLAALSGCPYGVVTWSEVLSDVVETSNNIGVVHIDQAQGFQAVIMVRSMRNESAEHFSQQIVEHFARYDLAATRAELVSGWTPNPDSAALKCLQDAYQTAFNIKPELKVIHAGLECGIIAQHYPHLQMVSFGPDIKGAHAPGERVKVDTVEKCWKLLVTALEQVPKAH